MDGLEKLFFDGGVSAFYVVIVETTNAIEMGENGEEMGCNLFFW